MSNAVERHTQRLRVICAAFLTSLGLYAGLVAALGGPVRPLLPQGEALMWGFAFLAAVNLVTIMPLYRVMLAGPRRVFAVGQQPDRLLAAHLAAHVTAFARLEAVALLGLVLYLLAGREDWFAVFTAVAALGMVILWPRRAKVVALLAVPGTPPITQTSPS